MCIRDSYYIAPIASGDCFVTDAKMRDYIYKTTGAYAVDMESASIGHICNCLLYTSKEPYC